MKLLCFTSLHLFSQHRSYIFHFHEKQMSMQINICRECNWDVRTHFDPRYECLLKLPVITHIVMVQKSSNGICVMSCFSKDMPASWLKWKKQTNRSRIEKDISYLFSSFGWYFQNYIKLHFLSDFACVIFVFHISATKQWKAKQVALNVKVELKHFVHFYSSYQSPAHFFENVSPCSHRNDRNLQCSTEFSYHLYLHMNHKHRRLSTSIHRTQENLLWIEIN